MNTTDLIGKRFGKLKVIKFDRVEYKRDNKGKNRNKGYWLCRCDCGSEITVNRNELVSGYKKSCGCLKKEIAIATSEKLLIDLTGKRFNNLLVVGLEKKEISQKNNGKNKYTYYWRCKCDCGEEVIVSGKILREGHVQDCEDVKRNNTKTYTQIGNEFKKENILKEGTRLDYLSNKTSKANSSGVRGVSFKKDRNKFRAQIRFKGKDYHLGYFYTLEEAKKAREKAEEILYKPMLEKYNYKSKNMEENEMEL